MAVQKYIIDKDDIGKLIRGEEIAIMPRGNIRAFQIEVNDLKNVTNGDVIKAIFPKGKVRREESWTHDRTVFSFPDGSYFGAECRFNTDWWNAPYKAENEG